MNIDEMKDRIARAEEIQRYTENRCEVLEKENADLKEEINKIAFARGNLEEENAELKEKLGNYQKGMFDEIEKRDINLTKAKELLKQWLQTSKASGCDNINIVTEAEQFLSEVEK